MRKSTVVAGVVLALALGSSVVLAPPARADGASLTSVIASSRCKDVIYIGAEGSGETAAQNEGLGPEVRTALDAYAGRMTGYDVGYFPVPYPATEAGFALVNEHHQKVFFDSIDAGVTLTLAFLKARANCPTEHYVLAGYSQGAMVMHRVLFELFYPSKKDRAFFTSVFSRLDGVIAIADGDKVSNQGGTALGTSSTDGFGISWSTLVNGADGTKYKPKWLVVPSTSTWAAGRFISVCNAGDLVCDPYPPDPNALGIHSDSYKPGGAASEAVAAGGRVAATTSKAVIPLKLALANLQKMRVGTQYDIWIQGPLDFSVPIESLTWTSAPLPGATLRPGNWVYIIPSMLTWTPPAAGTFQFSLAVTYTDGTVAAYSGNAQVYSIPAASLTVSNLAVTGSVISFTISKTAPSDTTPLTTMKDAEDPASDYYQLVSGDANSNGVLDVGEAWNYSGVVGWWSATDTQTRNILIRANDTTGATDFLEMTLPVVMHR